MTCLPVPVWSSALFNNTQNSLGSRINYYCPSGYRFNGTTNTTRSSICLKSTAEWSPPILDCIGRLSKMHILYK